MRVVGAYRRSNSSPFPRYDEDALDERRLVLQSSILARGGVVAKDFTEEFGFAGELEFDGLRRAREDVAEDCLFDCGGAISRRERERSRTCFGTSCTIELTINIFELLQCADIRFRVQDERGSRRLTVNVFELLQNIVFRAVARDGRSCLGPCVRIGLP